MQCLERQWQWCTPTMSTEHSGQDGLQKTSSLEKGNPVTESEPEPLTVRRGGSAELENGW
jgi:hypothetical protein